MITQTELLSPVSHSQVQFPLDRYVRPHLAMTEFGFGDPWSQLTTDAVGGKAREGWFGGKILLELGIGDGRQVRKAAVESLGIGKPVEQIIGVELDPKKIPLAVANLRGDPDVGHMINEGKVQIYQGDAVEFLSDWHTAQREKFGGRAIICLPQASGNGSSSDVIGGVYDSYTEYKDYGLTLNAAALDHLRKVSTPEAEALIVLSGRINPNVHTQLFKATGWRQEGYVRRLVKQDEDTPIDWMSGLEDDGKRFKNHAGQEISIKKAIALKNSGQPVFHHVYVYRVSSASNKY